MRPKLINFQLPSVLREMFETAIVFLYPAKCRVCEAFSWRYIYALYLCELLAGTFNSSKPPWCDICGTPDVKGLCDACATTPPRYGQLRTVALYQTTLQQAIHLFKI